MRAHRLLCAGALGLVLAGCTGGVHRYHPNFYSVDGDIRLGQQLAKEIEAEVTLLRLSALTQLVNAIGTRLQEASPEPAFRRFPYSFRDLGEEAPAAIGLLATHLDEEMQDAGVHARR